MSKEAEQARLIDLLDGALWDILFADDPDGTRAALFQEMRDLSYETGHTEGLPMLFAVRLQRGINARYGIDEDEQPPRASTKLSREMFCFEDGFAISCAFKKLMTIRGIEADQLRVLYADFDVDSFLADDPRKYLASQFTTEMKRIYAQTLHLGGSPKPDPRGDR